MREKDWIKHIWLRCWITLKKLNKTDFVSHVHFKDGGLKFIPFVTVVPILYLPVDWFAMLKVKLSIASMNSNYGGFFSIPNKLKFDHINILKNLFIMEQEIINTCPPDRLICLMSYLWMSNFWGLLKKYQMLEIF